MSQSRYIITICIATLILLSSTAYADFFNIIESKVEWPFGTERQDIEKTLNLYRDFRSKNQLLLIQNTTKNSSILLQSTKSKKNSEVPLWVIPEGAIGVLLLKDEPIELMCIESHEMGEQKVSCKGVIEAGLLPDSMVVKSKKYWVGNFTSMLDLDLKLRSLGVHIIV